jgi:hypothetical protein
MKMKKIFLFMVVCVAMLVGVCFGADVVAVAPAPAPVGFLDWFKANTPAVLGVALALSELLSLIPAFKGNGILDTIVKGLKALSNKDVPA